mmetsp:Transcript_19582/g.78004  ORF Transcript_19582/g.78004 Transcript_19582/m.78004 type:complete len:605 (-) Transcript_19582:1165-2979(-)
MDVEQRLSNDSLLFENLLLLGFDPVKFSERHGTVFREDIFNKTGNKKAALPVLHFLFYRISPVETEKACKRCWPVADRAREREFLKLAHARFVELERSRVLPMGSSRKSLLESFGGTRFVDILLPLSSHALVCFLGREYASDDLVSEMISAIPVAREAARTSALSSTVLKARIIAQGRQYVRVRTAAEELESRRQEKLSDLTASIQALERDERPSPVEPETVDEMERIEENAFRLLEGLSSARERMKESSDVVVAILSDSDESPIREGPFADGSNSLPELVTKRHEALQNMEALLTGDCMDNGISRDLIALLEKHRNTVAALERALADLRSLSNTIDIELSQATRKVEVDSNFIGILGANVRGDEFEDLLASAAVYSREEPLRGNKQTDLISSTPQCESGAMLYQENRGALADASNTHEFTRAEPGAHEDRMDPKPAPDSLEASARDAISRRTPGREKTETSARGAQKACPTADRQVSKLSAYKSFKDVIGLPSMSPSLKRNLLSSTPRVLVSTEVRNLLSRHSQCLATPSPEAIAETPRRKLFATPLMTTTRRSSSAGGGFPSRAEPEPYHSTHMSISPYAGDDTVDLFDDSRSTLMTHHPSR